MRWREELTLICLTIIAARGVEKWLGSEFLTALVGLGLAVVFGSRFREAIKSAKVRQGRANR